MNIKHIFISLIFLLTYQVYSFSLFCMSTCASKSCDNIAYNRCNNCTTGFMKDPNDSPSSGKAACITETLNNVSTGPKYMPVGKTSDITYDLKSLTTVQTLGVTASSGVTTTNCTKDSNNNYTYYGNLLNSDTLTITHSTGILDSNIHFYKVRIRGGVFLKDDWDSSSKLNVTFTTNSSQQPLQFSIDPDDNAMSNFKVCGSSSDDEYYRVFNGQFFYNDSSPMQFVLSVSGNSDTNPWGIMYFVVQVRLCHAYCLSCFGDSFTNCYSCDFLNQQMLLSGTTCALTCFTGYGYNSNAPDICIKCQDNCSSCYQVETNCTQCDPGYFLLDNGTAVNCVNPCPSHYYPNTTGLDHCQVCDLNCQNCSLISTRCTSCYPGFYLYNFTCYNPCPVQTYADTNLSRCINCSNNCYTCSGNSTNCSVCDINGTFISYLLNNTCLVECGPGYYEDNNGAVGPNLCMNCTTECATCNFNATYCLSCNPGFYLYNFSCNSTCPDGYFPDNNTWTCKDCGIYCVNLTMNLYFQNNLKQTLICDLTFQYALNWTATDIQSFVTISVVDPLITLSSFNIDYIVVSPTIMRIALTPKGYIFIYNATFTFTTISNNGTKHKAANGYPFSDTTYLSSKSISWFLIKAPSLSQTQKEIIDGVSKISDKVLNFTTLPFIQQIKKAGIFAMLLSGAQATSTACLVNTIPPQNFYEGVRIWASFVFYDVPAWQQNSQKSKLIIAPQANEVIKDARLLQQSQESRTLFDITKLQWRFQRTGHTSFFIFDTYMNLLLMLTCWILVIVANKCIKHKLQNKKYVGLFYSILHKIHEISIFYISLSTLLQWIYFDAASAERWVSFILCLVFNVYFLFYQLYIYYDMINYPTAEIGNSKYQYYVLRYGSFLKNIKFIEYDKTQPWTFRHWFRPYNYHILSYYKKFLMMIALPIFYETLYMQTYCLMAIQLFEIIRFIIVWPFKSRIHNIIRLGLQFVLFFFFGTIVIQTMMVKQIMLSDPNTLQRSVNLFYNLGWAGFVLVFVFNIGHLVLFIYNTLIGCRRSNAQLMDEARKFYYMQKLESYETQNEDVPLALVNKWVKLGNLNNRRIDQLPDINLRIQYFRIVKTSATTFQIQMRKLVQIFMNIEFNFQKQNNITASKKINKRFTLDKKLHSQFFYLIDDLYRKHTSVMDFEHMTIKTFQRVVQSDFKPGDKIELKPQIMSQKVELQSYAGQKKVIKLESILPGFPIPYADLKAFI